MFNLKYIKLNYKERNINPTVYNFGLLNYIYGDNDVGKTVMLQTIDFVLGKSNFPFDQIDGLDGIESVEAEVQNNGQSLYLKRSEYDYGYKYSVDDSDYLVVDENLYKKVITMLISEDSSKYFDKFKAYVEEDLTFRAFSFLNFVDEKGLGDLTNIFTRIDSYYNQKRARKLMSFIFNYNNVSLLIDLKIKEENLQKELEELAGYEANYNYLYNTIIRGCNNLQIQINSGDTLDDIHKAFEQFTITFKRNSKKRNHKPDDLAVLTKISYSLSEELKYQQNLERQTQHLISRNKKAEQMLNAFKDLINVDAEYSVYVAEIEELIKKQKSDFNIISVKDFKSTIEEIKKKKESVDEYLIDCQQGLSKNPYATTLKVIGRLEQAFSDIANIPNMKEIRDKTNALNLIRRKIKEVNNQFDETLKKIFDEKIYSLYKQLVSVVDFAKVDFDQAGFGMSFDPLRISISGRRAKSKDENEIVSYNPGSMARETTWQAMAYIVMFQILNENFKELPVMPILFIDGLNQPYDESPNNYSEVCNLICNAAENIGLQLFIVSTRDGSDINCANKIHLTGFNKAHKK